eukprot:g22933.t1
MLHQVFVDAIDPFMTQSKQFRFVPTTCLVLSYLRVLLIPCYEVNLQAKPQPKMIHPAFWLGLDSEIGELDHFLKAAPGPAPNYFINTIKTIVTTGNTQVLRQEGRTIERGIHRAVPLDLRSIGSHDPYHVFFRTSPS